MIFKVTIGFVFSSSLSILIKVQYPEGLQESIALKPFILRNMTTATKF